MSGFIRLAQLKQAIRDRLHEGLGAVTIFNELRSKAQFSDITPEEVKLFYNPLSEEVSAAEFTVEEQVRRNDQKIAVLEPYLRTHQGYLVEHEQLLAEHQQELAVRRQQFQEREEQYEDRAIELDAIELEENDLMSFELLKQFEEEYLNPYIAHQQEFEEHQQEFVAYRRLVEEVGLELTRKQQKKLELEFLSQNQGILQQNPNKFLIYDETLVNPPDIKCFWGGRFFATAGDRDANTGTCSIGFYDMFQGKTKSFAIQTAIRICQIYALRDPYFLLCESRGGSHCHYLYLAKLDFKNESWQIVHTSEPRNFDRILVNESDSSKFLLQRDNDFDECRLVGNEIQLVKNSALESRYKVGSYFDKKFCTLKFVPQDDQFENVKLTQVKMHIYDLERNENSTHDLDDTPDTLDCSSVMLLKFAWMRDTVFFPVEFRSLNKYGVIFTNPQMGGWKVVEFGVIDSTITRIRSFDGENLLICAEKWEEGEPSERKVYKLQMRKPDLLRNMAWMAIVKLYKEAGAEDPYQEARQDLPLNSELQPFMLNYSSE